MPTTPRLQLPLLLTGQGQKELTHNEALLLLDLLIQPVTSAAPANEAPSSPVHGQIYLCGASPVGEWEGQAHALALSTAAGWRFVAPFEGQRVLILGSGYERIFLGGSWTTGIVRASNLEVAGKTVVAAQQPAIAAAAGGTVIDVEARLALNAVLAALRAHGLVAS